jgi:GntR family transcriptional regulator
VSYQFSSPFPKYLQIREVLARRIDRDMKLGEQLPTEQALCNQFAVSRETVREALRGLEDSGLITRSPGRGTFVLRRPPRSSDSRLTGLAEDFIALKFNTEAHTLAAGPVVPPINVAESLGLAEEETMYRIERLRTLEGRPFALHEAFFPLEIGLRISRVDLSKSSIVRVMREKLGINAREDHTRIEAVAADPEMATRLEVALGAPLLMVTRHFVLPRPRNAVVFRAYFRADRYYYTVKFGQNPPPKPRAKPRPFRAPSRSQQRRSGDSRQ